MTTVGSGYSLPSVSARYNAPIICQRNDHPGSLDSTVKSVHFNTVHNCEQLAANRAPPRGVSPLTDVDEDPQGPGLNTSSLTAANVGQSLPASYRCPRSMTDNSHKPLTALVEPSTPIATINRYYSAQPRTIYPSGLGTQTAVTVCRNGGGDGCPGLIANGPHSLGPQCTVTDDGCVSTPASRLRHYCV